MLFCNGEKVNEKGKANLMKLTIKSYIIEFLNKHPMLKKNVIQYTRLIKSRFLMRN